MIKKFKCGLCKEKDRIWMTRLGLRKHLQEEHRIMNQKFNRGYIQKIGWDKQKWIIEEECE